MQTSNAQRAGSLCSCIILAGGEGKRVSGQDKGLLEYKGRTLIQHVIDSIREQVDDIVISANRNIDEYRAYGYDVIPDLNKHTDGRYRGPMSGIASCLQYCKHGWVLVVACDMPHLPDDLVEQLSTGKKNSSICIAETEGRLQLAMLCHKNVSDSLQQAMKNDEFKLMRWVDLHQPHIVSFSDGKSFRNFNHLEELTQ